MNLRRIGAKDQIDILKIYFNSINSINEKIYSKKQKIAWSSQSWMNLEFRKTLSEGKGWILEKDLNKIGFAIRYPADKLALFYCSENYQRKGYGTTLLKRIEEDAISEDIYLLKTDASLISYKLLLKYDWKIIRKEKIIINDQIFYRYNMHKKLMDQSKKTKG